MSNDHSSLANPLFGLFRRHDRNNDGQLEFEEFKACLNEMNMEMHVSDEEARAIFDDLDEDGSGTISSKEFYTLIPIINRFQYYDRDGDGQISPEELKTTFEEMGDNFTDEEIDDLMDQVDTNRSGMIEFMEFYRLTKRFHV